jgi:hypothetical protein
LCDSKLNFASTFFKGQESYNPSPSFRNSPSIQTIEEIYLYTGADLFADIGGYLGLLLGISVFTVYEKITEVLKACRFSCLQETKTEDE